MSGSKSRVNACLNPPTITELDASQGLPPWITLDARVYLADRNNSTTAGAETSKGHAVHVTICFTHPPALSYVCIHCPGLQHANFAGEPRVVCSEKQFLLLHLPLNWSTTSFVRRSSEYFMYQAVPGRPTLSRIPDPPGRRSFLVPSDLGIHCCGDNGEYMLAGLCPSRDDGYELHLFSSVSRDWTRKPAYLERLPTDEQLPLAAHKVIPLGGSLLGWVDLWRGIMVCDVLSDETLHYVRRRLIPLPGLMPGNEADRHLCPWIIRDITCINGSLKLVEIELVSLSPKNKEEEEEEEGIAAAYLPDKTCDDSSFVKQNNDLDSMEPHKLIGWRSVIWKRLLSDDGWRRGCLVHGEDILVVNPDHSALLAELEDNTSGNSSIINLLPSFPTLSINGDDVVHMNCLVRLDSKKAQMISIDMGNKTLKTMVPCPAAELDDHCPSFPCVLSNHLSSTPALRQIVRASNSRTVTEKQQLWSCAQEVTDMPNQAHDALLQMVHASPSVNMTENQCWSSRAQEVVVAPNQAHNGGSNLTSHQSFGMLDTLTTTGYNRSHNAYADCTHPGYGNYQQSWPLQHQPIFQPNWVLHPGWFSSGPMNVHPAYPVVNTVAFGQMMHPFPLNNYLPFHPPSQAPELPMPSTPSIPAAVGGHSLHGSMRPRARQNTPYERPCRMIPPANEGFY